MITVNGRREDWSAGLTVARLLERMGYGLIHITVTVNEQVVPEEDYAAFPIPDGAQVHAIHLHHGG
ncbi:MAG: thiamine biosynthesis protein ThiS [Elusimicrobia bacterium GWA2_69_24]|nr:MAG: thiamine biosynthesis protein ThiS [Elusimicrobia bacterium GWA2_69_24]HBL15218.1 thiamine biosynthesis protein ThiS [Elusimicrobiota bacterium]